MAPPHPSVRTRRGREPARPSRPAGLLAAEVDGRILRDDAAGIALAARIALRRSRRRPAATIVDGLPIRAATRRRIDHARILARRRVVWIGAWRRRACRIRVWITCW